MFYSSEKHRYYQSPAFITKYDVNLIAANFFYSEFKPCVEKVLDTLDQPSPQYIVKSEERAKLPSDPYAYDGRYGRIKHLSLKAERNYYRAHVGQQKSHSHRVHYANSWQF